MSPIDVYKINNRKSLTQLSRVCHIQEMLLHCLYRDMRPSVPTAIK